MKKYIAEIGTRVYKITDEQVETMCALCKGELKSINFEPACVTCGFYKDNLKECEEDK